MHVCIGFDGVVMAQQPLELAMAIVWKVLIGVEVNRSRFHNQEGKSQMSTRHPLVGICLHGRGAERWNLVEAGAV